MMGVVNLDKPVGPTSHDMVGLLRRLTGMRRIGHAGTLDPLASGILPVLVGAATRFSEELTGGGKRYEATIRLGWRSATDDGEGPLERGGPLPEMDAVRTALASFVGEQEQRPPTFSARKMGGRTAHRAARAGEALDLPSRRVTITAIELIHAETAADHLDLRIDLRCGPGTYVRALARDLGERLGGGGYLAALRRTEASGLTADESVGPETLTALAESGSLEDALIPVGRLLPLPHACLADDEAERFIHGSVVHLGAEGTAGGRRAVFAGERLLGIGVLNGGMLQPDKVVVTGGR